MDEYDFQIWYRDNGKRMLDKEQRPYDCMFEACKAGYAQGRYDAIVNFIILLGVIAVFVIGGIL